MPYILHKYFDSKLIGKILNNAGYDKLLKLKNKVNKAAFSSAISCGRVSDLGKGKISLEVRGRMDSH